MIFKSSVVVTNFFLKFEKSIFEIILSSSDAYFKLLLDVLIIQC